MARLNTSEITIKVSKIQRDTEDDVILISDETIEQLEAIITELVGSGVVVEIENING